MATDVISAFGAGSGVDVKSLANSLVDAERQPRKTALDEKIKKSENGISGYAAIKFVLDGLKTALTDLKDQSDFNTQNPRNSQPSAIAVTGSGQASAGSHSIIVNKLAQAQKLASNGFATSSESLNNGNSISLSLSVNGAASEILQVPAGSDTPKGVVAAINSAGKGVTAQLINTGDSTKPFKIILTGVSGASNSFEISSDSGGIDFDTKIQSSANGEAYIDGLKVEPAVNKLTGLVPGVTLELLSTTNGAATFEVTRDKAAIQSKVEALVVAYNDANSLLGVVSDPKSTVEGYGASLISNPIVGTVRNMMREVIFTDTNSPSGGLKNMRDLGITVDRYGKMSLDKAKLDTVLTDKFEDVVTLMSNNQENLSTFSAAKAGAAGEGVKKLASMLATNGILTAQSTNLTKQITGYNEELAKLETRMTMLLARYNKQFGTMETIVGQGKNVRSSLTNMMAAYNKN
jgi:flagellar hook-associated protein 2